MKELNVKFTCFGNVSILNSDEIFLKLAHDAGCVAWSIGFESISQKNLENINKKTNQVDNYVSTVKKIHDHGMAVIGSFIFGFEEDAPDIFPRTLNIIYTMELDSADFYILTPFPGTLLYNYLDRNGRIITKDWSKYTGGNVIFKPKNMSEEELLIGAREIAHEFYTIKNFLKRMTNSMKIGFYPFLETSSRNFSNQFYQLSCPTLRR